MNGKPRNTFLALLATAMWFGVLALGGVLAFWAQGLNPGAPPSGTEPPAGSTPPAGPMVFPPTWTAAPTGIATPPGGTRSPGVIIEPTFTPILPFTPTPTFFITPIPFYEGPIEIGQSVGGRPLEIHRFGSGPVHRLIVAGIHGGYEFNTILLADELIAHLRAHPELVPRTVTLFILRALNPDGFARDLGVSGRVNDNGVDLNRNFPINWLADWDRDLCWNYAPTTGGASPGSEPETQALMKYVLEETRVTAIISYHSAALGIFPGGDPADEASARLAEAVAAASTYPYPPVDIGCVYSGTLPDWAAANGIAAIDLELHDHENTDFEENLGILQVFLNWRR